MIACQLGEDFLEAAYPCQTDETFPLAGGGRGVTSTAATPTSSQGRPGLGARGPPLPARLAWSASVSKVTGRLVTASLAARERQRQGGSARRRVLSCCLCLPSPPPAPATRPWSGSPPFPARPPFLPPGSPRHTPDSSREAGRGSSHCTNIVLSGCTLPPLLS